LEFVWYWGVAKR